MRWINVHYFALFVHVNYNLINLNWTLFWVIINRTLKKHFVCIALNWNVEFFVTTFVRSVVVLYHFSSSLGEDRQKQLLVCFAGREWRLKSQRGFMYRPNEWGRGRRGEDKMKRYKPAASGVSLFTNDSLRNERDLIVFSFKDIQWCR